MDFRTQIEIPQKSELRITHDDGIVMLGSCFTDNIGDKLAFDGFDVVHNPMGALYNPASLLNVITLALDPDSRQSLIIKTDTEGTYHCLNFASKYQNVSLDGLLSEINEQLDLLGDKLRQASTIIITLGTSYVFSLNDTDAIVGNCHKFTANEFTRRRLSADEAVSCLKGIINLLGAKNVIFTVSPIRHTADGLHGNQLSKATLQLAVDQVTNGNTVHYFPAYEIVLDDLRDYRFYAADMKHPSAVAIDYIYETFGKYYFSQATFEQAMKARKANLRFAHRQIIS